MTTMAVPAAATSVGVQVLEPAAAGSRTKANADDTSAGKALALLDAFGGQFAVLGVTALAARAGMAKSTAHRLLTVLVSHGYVQRVGDRYSLTEHLFEMGNQIRSCRPNGIREVARPYLGELFAATRETVQLAVLSGTEVLYLDKIAGREGALCPTWVGGRRPAYATALGKALVGFGSAADLELNLRVRLRRFTPYTMVTPAQLRRSFERARQDGIATDHEELRSGVNCIAAPILDRRSGRALAAISICSVSSQLEQRHQRVLLRTADALSRQCIAAA